MGLNVGASTAGGFDGFQKFSMSRFAYKHLFVVESNIEGAELPSLFVLRGVFPYSEIETFPLERDNSNIYYPEISDVPDMELELYETMDNQVFDFFENWYNKIFASNERDDIVFNLPSLFKKNIYVFRLDTMGAEGSNEFTRVFGFEYSGCFPKRITDYPLDMSDPDAVTLGITFSVDNVRRLKNGEGVSEPSNTGGTFPNTAKPQTTLASPDIPNPEPAQVLPVEGAKGFDLGKKIEQKVKAKVEGYKKQITSASIGVWAAALIKAAAATGINIAEREAYRMAYAAGKKYGDIAGGVRQGGNLLRGTF
jgi:hypothetical protein